MYDMVSLWYSAAIDIKPKFYNFDNVLLCLVSELKERYQKYIIYGLSPSEFDNGHNIYLLMLERVRFLNKNKD